MVMMMTSVMKVKLTKLITKQRSPQKLGHLSSMCILANKPIKTIADQPESNPSGEAHYCNSDVDVTSVLNTQEIDKKATEKDLASMSALQQAHAKQHMDLPSCKTVLSEHSSSLPPAVLSVSIARSANTIQQLQLG